jgi:hypothetical protein
MSTSSLHGALAAHLDTFAQARGLLVAWEARAFAAPVALHLREKSLPAGNVAGALGVLAPNRFAGVYQVEAVGPGGRGSGEVRALADAVAAHFARGTKLAVGPDELTIERAEPGPGMTEHDGRFRVPVSISFYAYLAP